MMNPTKKVFITGLGALSSCGESLEKTWQALLAGESGIAPIEQWDIADWSTSLGGELKNFQAARLLPDRKLAKVISRQDVMGINAAVQAIEHSGLIRYRDSLTDASEFNDNTAVFAGSPGNKYFQQYDFLNLLAQSKGDMQVFAANLFNEVHPMWLLRILPNNVLAYTGIAYNLKGANHNITNHAVGGAQAIIEAYNAIISGQAERAVVVAYDTGIEPQAMFYYDKLGVLSENHLCPFDQKHNGTILAEGAAALVLESEESALARSARCYAELLGGLSTTEGKSLFSIDEGEALTQLIEKSLKHCQISPDEIDFIVAHGNGNVKSDDSEAVAISANFAASTPVTAFKWAMGHSLTASGIMDAVLAVSALQASYLPGIMNLEKKARSAEMLNISAQHRELKDSNTALLINRGFASMNACLVIKSCE